MALPNRKRTRLKGYDYSTENYYFLTLCTHQKRCILGMGGTKTVLGNIAEQELLHISDHFPAVKIDAYVIMPNHIHAILVLGCDEGAERSRPFPTVSTVVGLYKSGVSRRVHERFPSVTVWQTSFYDHIISHPSEYDEIRKYIEENPLKWALDEFYRAN